MVDTAPTEDVSCAGRVTARGISASTLDAAFPGWRGCTREQQLRLAQEVDAEYRETTSNVTCVGLHEWVVDCLHASSVDPPELDRVALGRSDTTPTSSDTMLNDKVDDVDITSFADEGTQIRITAFVGEQEANVDTQAGETLSEVGVLADGKLLNHALLPTDYEKSSIKTMTIEVVLAFSAA